MKTFSRADGSEFKDAERATRTYLDRTLPAVIRLDGRAFHSYCKGLKRPYDTGFMDDMDQVTLTLAQQVDGVRLAYVQSDEISLLLLPNLTLEDRAEFMFGGQVQKLVSITAAIASSVLNTARYGKVTDKLALFDSRAFTLPDMDAVTRYFQWRQGDAQVNSLSMLASTHFSHKQLAGVGNRDRVTMLRDAGIDPDELPVSFRRGRVVLREPVQKQTTFTGRDGIPRTVDFVRQQAYVTAAPSFEHGLDAAFY